MRETAVLIVGGGPIGLTASCLLSQLGIASILVERRLTTSIHPRARSVDVRSMEIFRQLGVSADLRADALPPDWTRVVYFLETLTGREIGQIPTPEFHSIPRPTTPEVPLMTSQDRVEPVLLELARSCDVGEVLLGVELLGLASEQTGVRATLRSTESGSDEEIFASYMIAADGVASPIRKSLGLQLEGQRSVSTIYDVLFDADLSRWVGDRFGSLLFVTHTEGTGIFQPLDAERRWRCQIVSFASGRAPKEVTPKICASWIAAAAGAAAIDDLSVTSVSPWSINAAVANQFRTDRVLLAGDAAHALVPTGGLGMNTGVHGIHNLVWKLARVISGAAGDALLDTYEIERRPVVERNLQFSIENALLSANVLQVHAAGGDLQDALGRASQYGNFSGLILGFEYRSPLCIPCSQDANDPADTIREFIAQLRPGRRAPHGWLDQAQSRSTLDLFGRNHVLLTATDSASASRWEDGARKSHPTLPLDIAEIPKPLRSQPAFAPLDDHVALVRPDGVVAAVWEASDRDPAAALRDYANRVSSRSA